MLLNITQYNTSVFKQQSSQMEYHNEDAVIAVVLMMDF